MRWNGASSCELVEKSMETETTTWSEFPNGGKTIAEQILVSEERNKSKRVGLWESPTEFRWWISSTRIDKPVLMMDVRVPKTKRLADGLIERTSSMLDEIKSKTVHKAEEVDRQRKKK